MNEPMRWIHDPEHPSPELARGIEEGARPLRPLAPAAQARVWQAIAQRSAARAGFNWDWALVPALGLSLGLLVIALRLPHGAPEESLPPPLPSAAIDRIAVGAIAQLEVTKGAVVQVPPVSATGESVAAGYRMTLTSGKVCARVQHRDLAHEGPFVVMAPGLNVVVIGTRFCVESDGDFTNVQVTEGKVRIQRAQIADVLVAAGEALTSDAHAAAPVAPAVVNPTLQPAPAAAAVAPVTAPSAVPTAVPGAVSDVVARCAAVVSLDARANCYAGLVGTDDLTAQNALFALALLSRDDLRDGPAALSHFRTYLARFPKGVLAAEARQNVIAELFAEGRLREAQAEADRYLKSYSWDGRAAEIALLRAGILRRDQGRRDQALTAYREILDRDAPSSVRDDALYGAIVSAFDVGESAQARVDLTRYQSEFPQGKHAAEVEALRAR